MIEKGAVFPMFYLPPVEYFTKLNALRADIFMEKEEHFPKQTFRNRANICTPDGTLSLTVPVIKGSKNHTKSKDVKISYDFDWQRLHWMSLQSCYRRSAYFEYYEDELSRFYHNQFEYLFDFNEQLLQFVLKSIRLKITWDYTTSYESTYADLIDYRNVIDSKQESDFDQKHYFQVFEDRNGFIKNLSIVDLMFNQGPHSSDYL
ncbi:MAG TPA: WbqC family protein [Mucilaginibacter sp.]|nr:WbqC family protein [Mucilaginibacter sp.]